jgi:hypothetical protein
MTAVSGEVSKLLLYVRVAKPHLDEPTIRHLHRLDETHWLAILGCKRGQRQLASN